jgi:hypothetical protein
MIVEYWAKKDNGIEITDLYFGENEGALVNDLLLWAKEHKVEDEQFGIRYLDKEEQESILKRLVKENSRFKINNTILSSTVIDIQILLSSFMRSNFSQKELISNIFLLRKSIENIINIIESKGIKNTFK